MGWILGRCFVCLFLSHHLRTSNDSSLGVYYDRGICTYVSNDSDYKCTVLSSSFKRYRTTETEESIYYFLLLLCKSKANEYLIWVVGKLITKLSCILIINELNYQYATVLPRELATCRAFLYFQNSFQ